MTASYEYRGERVVESKSSSSGRIGLEEVKRR